MTIDPLIFRAYDIRGLADTQLTEDGCRAIGFSFGQTVQELYNIEVPRIAVGRDARTHGPKYQNALTEGLLLAGCHVLDIGQTPSPVNYFTICDQELDGGMHITASHNGPEYNGIKLQVRHAEAFSGDDLQTLRKRIEQTTIDSPPHTQHSTPYDAVSPYIEHLVSMFTGAGEGLHIVVDHGNGVAGPVYNEALRRIGCTVTELYSEPDGEFPNHPADPSKHETLKELQESVVANNADLGLAFDGDGDRMGVVDAQGTIRTADEILLLLAEDHLSRHSGAPVVFTVSNSSILDSEITRLGGVPHMCTVGHSFVEHAMHEHGAKLGGEQSGHFFLAEDYFNFDDALMAALRTISILQKTQKSYADLVGRFPVVFQAPERRPHCPDDKKTAIVSALTEHFQQQYPVNTLDGARIDFGDNAWAGIRQSNTSPCLSVCIEARSTEKLKEVEDIVLTALQSYDDIEL